MNKEVDQTVTLILEKLLQATEAAVDFSKEEIPVLIREIISYNIYSNILDICFSIFIVILPILLAIKWLFIWFEKFIKERFKNLDDEGSARIAAAALMIIPILIIAGSCSSILSNCSELLKLYFAPRLFLLEYLKSFSR